VRTQLLLLFVPAVALGKPAGGTYKLAVDKDVTPRDRDGTKLRRCDSERASEWASFEVEVAGRDAHVNGRSWIVDASGGKLVLTDPATPSHTRVDLVIVGQGAHPYEAAILYIDDRGKQPCGDTRELRIDSFHGE
jgi:hypothetical protein